MAARPSATGATWPIGSAGAPPSTTPPRIRRLNPALECRRRGPTSPRTGRKRHMNSTDPNKEDTPLSPAEPQLDAASADVNATPEQRLAELEAKHAEMADAYLRAKAETENIRRRADEEMAKARKYAVEAFAESLLPVKDSLEAAIAVETS